MVKCAGVLIVSVVLSALGNATPDLNSSLGEAWIAPDGSWCAYRWSAKLASGLQLVNLDSGESATIAGGERPEFSQDSRWIAYSLPKNRAVLRRLADGHERVFDPAPASLMFLGGGQHLLIRYPPVSGGASRMVLVDLALQKETTIEVADVAVHPKGDLVAWVASSEATNHTVNVLDLQKNVRASVYTTTGRVGSLTWHWKERRIGVFERAPPSKESRNAVTSVTIDGLFSENPAVFRIETHDQQSFPRNHVLARPWTNGSRSPGMVLLDRTSEPPARTSGDRQSNLVEVWHGDDPVLFPFRDKPTRMLNSNSDNVYWYSPEGEIWERISNQSDEELSELGFQSNRFVGIREHIGPNARQTFTVRLWDQVKRTVTTIVDNSTALPAYDQIRGGPILYFEESNWHEFDPETGSRTNLTEAAKTTWTRAKDGMEQSFLQPATDAEILSDGSILLGDRFDMYRWKAGARLQRLSDGSANGIVYRAVVPNLTEPINASGPIFFTTYNGQSKESGFAVVDPGASHVRDVYRANARLFNPHRLVQSTIYRTPLVISEDGKRILFCRETFHDPPNLFVADYDFREIREVSRLDPAVDAGRWGQAELVSYTACGEALQGIVVAPAELSKGKKHPLVVIVYERQSDDLHRFDTPNPGNFRDVRTLSQLGYFVLQPDIAYRLGDPGPAIVESLESALKAALEQYSSIDESRVGLMGASFGGYETLLSMANSNKFAAGVAINPPTDLVSNHGQLQRTYRRPAWEDIELGHGRMGVPLTEDPARYMRNSPIFHARSINGPVLLAHGEQDGVVDWRQSVEMYLALRRLNKPVILLNYPKEKHGIAGKEASQDLAQRVRHFFDVHLRGAPAQDWMKADR
jgi:dipeptidyl aminopeptidase/acylaminoacyl peptidase